MLSAVSSGVSFTDPNRKAPRFQQYSVDLQRELPKNIGLMIGYVGARGDDLGYGTSVNLNQLPVEYLSLGSRLTSLVPNPFFGVAGAGTLANQATVQLNSLLVPFPQYGLNSVSETLGAAHSNYNALVLQLRKRVANGWGGNFSYTYSNLKDNQIGLGNYFSTGPGIVDNYSYILGSPTYNPDVDYGLGLLNQTHKLVISPIVQLPFGRGRAHLNKGGALDYLVGGWTISAVGLIQTGFPVGVTQTPNTTNLNGAGQRPNVNAGVGFLVEGDITDRLKAKPTDNLYLNPAAFSLAPGFTMGNAPRLLPDVTSPGRNSLDLGLNKAFRTGGSTAATFRIEIINVFDNPHYASLGSTAIGNASFGQVTTKANYSRFVQLSVRFNW